MASLVLTDAFVSVNGVNLSAWVKSVSLPYEVELVDDTAMGDGTRKNKAGLKTWSIDVEFKQDFAAAAVDATLFPLLGVATPIIVRPTSAAASATNPQYSGTGVLESYPILDGSLGDLLTSSVTFQSAGTLSRATS